MSYYGGVEFVSRICVFAFIMIVLCLITSLTEFCEFNPNKILSVRDFIVLRLDVLDTYLLILFFYLHKFQINFPGVATQEFVDALWQILLTR